MILDHPAAVLVSSGGHHHHHHFRSFSTFSGEAFRRKIIDAMSCGVSSRYRHHHHDYKNDNAPIARERVPTEKEKPKAATTTLFSGTNVKANGKSEKLVDMLNLAEWSESEVNAAAMRKKAEALERLLQAEDREKRREAAREITLLGRRKIRLPLLY